MEKYLCSFIAYMLVSKSGLYKGGRHCFKITEKNPKPLAGD